MRNDKCFEVEARDIFLRPLSIKNCEVVATLHHPMVLLFAGLLVLTLTIFDTANLQTYLAWWQSLLIWTIAVATQILAYTGLFLAWGWFRTRHAIPVVLAPLVGLLAYLVTYAVTVQLVQWSTGRSWEEVFVPEIMLTGYAFAMIGEAIYFAFVLPQLLRDIRQAGRGGAARSISIAGRRFPLDTVLTLRGQEHFVLVETLDDTYKVRGRLSDLVSQTEERDGVLAHRSYWVAGRAITRLEREADGRDCIVTTNGERLRVAQPRRVEVRAWVAQYAPDAANRKPGQA